MTDIIEPKPLTFDELNALRKAVEPDGALSFEEWGERLLQLKREKERREHGGEPPSKWASPWGHKT